MGGRGKRSVVTEEETARADCLVLKLRGRTRLGELVSNGPSSSPGPGCEGQRLVPPTCPISADRGRLHAAGAQAAVLYWLGDKRDSAVACKTTAQRLEVHCV